MMKAAVADSAADNVIDERRRAMAIVYPQPSMVGIFEYNHTGSW